MKIRQSVQYQNIDRGHCGSLSIKPCLGKRWLVYDIPDDS